PTASVANEATAAQLAVVGRTVLLPVRHESEPCYQRLEARVLPERPHLGQPETSGLHPDRAGACHLIEHALYILVRVVECTQQGVERGDQAYSVIHQAPRVSVQLDRL